MARQPGDSDFSNVNVAVAYKVAGTQVLGAQNATSLSFVNADLANTVALVNAIVAVLTVDHGLAAS